MAHNNDLSAVCLCRALMWRGSGRDRKNGWHSLLIYRVRYGVKKCNFAINVRISR